MRKVSAPEHPRLKELLHRIPFRPNAQARYAQLGQPEQLHWVCVRYLDDCSSGIVRWKKVPIDMLHKAQTTVGNRTHTDCADVMRTMLIKPHTKEWLESRRTKATGTGIVDLFDANEYFDKNVAELGAVPNPPRNGRELQLGRALGTLPPLKTNAHMKRGLDLEPEAIKCFEAATGLRIAPGQIGSITHVDGNLQVTPDALLDAVPVFVEIKCPWKTSDFPSKAWYLQMMAQMAATADPVTRIPKIRHAINVQYVRNRFVTLTMAMAEYDPVLGEEILANAASYVKELSLARSRLPTDEKKEAAEPSSSGGTAQMIRGGTARRGSRGMAQRGSRGTAQRGRGTGQRGRGSATAAAAAGTPARGRYRRVVVRARRVRKA